MVEAAIMTFLRVVLAHWVARNKAMARVAEGEAVTLTDYGRIDNQARKRIKNSDATCARLFVITASMARPRPTISNG